MAEGLGGGVAQVEDPTVDVGTAIVHQQQHAAAVLADEQQGAEGELLAGAGPALLVVDGAAGCGTAVEAGAVPGGGTGDDLARGLQARRDAGHGSEGPEGHEGLLALGGGPMAGD